MISMMMQWSYFSRSGLCCRICFSSTTSIMTDFKQNSRFCTSES